MAVLISRPPKDIIAFNLGQFDKHEIDNGLGPPAWLHRQAHQRQPGLMQERQE